jgi:hypothetical protein
MTAAQLLKAGKIAHLKETGGIRRTFDWHASIYTEEGDDCLYLQCLETGECWSITPNGTATKDRDGDTGSLLS